MHQVLSLILAVSGFHTTINWMFFTYQQKKPGFAHEIVCARVRDVQDGGANNNF